MKNFRKELKQALYKQDLIQVEYCDEDEQLEYENLLNQKLPLPDDVEKDHQGDFFRYAGTDLSEQEINQLLMLRQTLYLRTIKNCILFFVTPSLLIFVVFLLCLVF